ncbi:hypothetical protein [Vibrio sp. TBV020]|uniref:InvB/SpaK family type III secretion system chaperone n=1 Tax=Vibrio sp. TBV020 TaxID=3137398 RepID=UPI0038CD6D84
MYDNPLSFLSDSHKSLAYLVKEALSSLGCEDSYLKKLDSFSTITLDFTNANSINLSIEEERLCIWSHFNQDLSSLTLNSKRVLELISNPIDGIEMNLPVLGTSDNRVYIKALINVDILEDRHRFAKTIDNFYTLIKHISEMIN